MRFSACLVATFVAVLLPAQTRAQTSFEGLDLSGSFDEPTSSAGERAGQSRSAPPGKSARAPAVAPPASGAEKAELPRLREVDLTAEDRVKSVQPRGFLKDGRFDLTPIFFVTLNDAYYPKYGPGVRLAYHLHESLGLGLRFFQYNQIPNENVRLAKRQLSSQLPAVQPKGSLALDFLWSPFYGKVGVGNAIRHFDIYVVGGLGGVYSETSGDGGDGIHLETHIGVGNRFSLNDFLAIDLSFIETVYTDRPLNNGDKGVVQHILSVNLGLSVFLPFSFEYKEP